MENTNQNLIDTRATSLASNIATILEMKQQATNAEKNSISNLTDFYFGGKDESFQGSLNQMNAFANNGNGNCGEVKQINKNIININFQNNNVFDNSLEMFSNQHYQPVIKVTPINSTSSVKSQNELLNANSNLMNNNYPLSQLSFNQTPSNQYYSQNQYTYCNGDQMNYMNNMNGINILNNDQMNQNLNNQMFTNLNNINNYLNLTNTNINDANNNETYRLLNQMQTYWFFLNMLNAGKINL